MDIESNVEAVAQPDEVIAPEISEDTKVENTESEESANLPEKEETRPRGVQKRIDELTREKHENARDRDHWRGLALQALQQANQVQEPVYYDDGYDGQSYDYQYSPDEIARQVEARLMAARENEDFSRRTQEFKDKIKDPDAKMFAESEYAPITKPMAEAMLSSELGADVLTYLAKNQSEAARIRDLPPHLQGYEIGRIEARLVASKSRPTSAPVPAPTLGGQAKVEIDPNKLPINEWVKWRASQLK